MNKLNKSLIWEITDTSSGRTQLAFTKRQLDFLTGKMRRGNIWYSVKRVPRGRPKKEVTEEAQ